MMIQGSQVMNISPYMNGRHYVPNDSAKNLIRNQEGFDTLIDPISDDDPFMSFMKDAKVAYDYTGQRLIFVSSTNKGYQYVYKIDTQTWHKVAFGGLDLDVPLNSYPECLVMGYGTDIPQSALESAAQILNTNASSLKNTIETQSITTKRISDKETVFGELYNLGFSLDIDTSSQYKAYTIKITGSKNIDNPELYMYSLSYFLNTSPSEALKLLKGEKTGTYEDCLVDATEQQIHFQQLEEMFYFTHEETDEGHIVTFKIKYVSSRIYSLSTVLDASTQQDTAKGILITRPFDLGEPDVFKTIKAIKIRGDYDKGNVKYLLQGSDDGKTFYTLSSMRGKSWKMFRLFILADLEPTERISWVDIEYETRFKNRLR
jgi:hypothetical protein